jgi:hypothetical protein
MICQVVGFDIFIRRPLNNYRDAASSGRMSLSMLQMLWPLGLYQNSRGSLSCTIDIW